MATSSGSFPLFRFSGIQVYLHWSWFIVAWIESPPAADVWHLGWNVAEYLGLFVIVLLHEFGHLLACRQTGGVANEIVLWPLGGVARGRPPPRPGAELWTIAAGPAGECRALAGAHGRDAGVPGFGDQQSVS
jgi:Zn-dependent protease